MVHGLPFCHQKHNQPDHRVRYRFNLRMTLMRLPTTRYQSTLRTHSGKRKLFERLIRDWRARSLSPRTIFFVCVACTQYRKTLSSVTHKTMPRPDTAKRLSTGLSKNTTRIRSFLKRRRINLINLNRMLPNTALNLTRYIGASRLVARRLAWR